MFMKSNQSTIYINVIQSNPSRLTDLSVNCKYGEPVIASSPWTSEGLWRRGWRGIVGDGSKASSAYSMSSSTELCVGYIKIYTRKSCNTDYEGIIYRGQLTFIVSYISKFTLFRVVTARNGSDVLIDYGRKTETQFPSSPFLIQ